MKLEQLDPNPTSNPNDGGVDVVAWKPFGDERPGYVTLLCQCTIEKKWYTEASRKARDINLTDWVTWIRFGLPPLTAIAVPFLLDGTFEERWRDTLRDVHIILDRMRICEFIDPALVPRLDHIRGWNAAERERLQARYSAA